jgi:hypothetical protein
MRGIPKFNFPAFDRAAKKLRAEGHIVFSPADADRWMELIGRPVTARECFESDCVYICRYAEAVVLLPGWEKSKGARAEKALAEAIGAEVIYYDDEDGK